MEQMKGIKFHSNYARMYCGILFLFFWVLYLIDHNFYGLVLLVATGIVFIICSVIKVKVIIEKSGIYSPKIDLLIPWEEIKGISHVVVGGTESAGSSFIIHNPRTLIVHQKEYPSMCFYYTSVLTLLAIKRYAPKIKSNLFTAILVELYRMLCIVYLLRVIYMIFLHSSNFPISTVLVLPIMWVIQVFVIPLASVYIINKHWGSNFKYDIRS